MMKRTNCYAVASRSRDPNNPGNRKTAGIKTEQRLEIKWNGIANSITHVAKDCYILEEYEEI